MQTIGTFPFGEPVRIVQQQDRAPKQGFVLGVYASAVHARWVGPDGRPRVRALAVASEPEIFWRGEGAAEIVADIPIPPELGRLEPAAPSFNGPSGRALDEHFLLPLGLRREQAWLCDLVPHSCTNPAQARAIERAYQPLAAAHNLPPVTVPPVPRQFSDERRRQEILAEIAASGAGLLILLGDQPIRWFLRFYDDRWRRLADFGTTIETYGRRHAVELDGRAIEVLPLAHPRQAGRLGRASKRWYDLHWGWEEAAGPFQPTRAVF